MGCWHNDKIQIIIKLLQAQRELNSKGCWHYG